MEELKNLLENISDSYYDFVVGILNKAKRYPEKSDELIEYIKNNPNIHTSEVVEWVLKTFDKIDLSAPKSIIVESKAR